MMAAAGWADRIRRRSPAGNGSPDRTIRRIGGSFPQTSATTVGVPCTASGRCRSIARVPSSTLDTGIAATWSPATREASRSHTRPALKAGLRSDATRHLAEDRATLSATACALAIARATWRSTTLPAPVVPPDDTPTRAADEGYRDAGRPAIIR